MIRYDDPLDLFRAAVTALNAADYTTVVSLCDPVSMRAFKRTIVSRFSHPSEPPQQWTAEQFMQHDPLLPRVVAEHYVTQMARRPDQTDELRTALPGIADFTELETASPEAVFAAWLDGCSPQTMLRNLQSDGALSPEMTAQFAPSVSHIWNWVPLGAVIGTGPIAHILYREAHGAADDDASQWVQSPVEYPADERALAADLREAGHFVSVQPCRRQPDGGWLLVAGDNFLRPDGMAFMAGEEPADDADAD